MRRFAPTLLLAIPFVVGLAPHAMDAMPTIEIALSRVAFSPERTEVALGEPVRLHVVSTDGTVKHEAARLLGISPLALSRYLAKHSLIVQKRAQR